MLLATGSRRVASSPVAQLSAIAVNLQVSYQNEKCPGKVVSRAHDSFVSIARLRVEQPERGELEVTVIPSMYSEALLPI
jgi:hypothetical protein